MMNPTSARHTFLTQVSHLGFPPEPFRSKGEKELGKGEIPRILPFVRDQLSFYTNGFSFYTNVEFSLKEKGFLIFPIYRKIIIYLIADFL